MQLYKIKYLNVRSKNKNLKRFNKYNLNWQNHVQKQLPLCKLKNKIEFMNGLCLRYVLFKCMLLYPFLPLFNILWSVAYQERVYEVITFWNVFETKKKIQIIQNTYCYYTICN